MHLAVLGGLYLLSVAAGYQLDKFELVYSTQARLGLAVLGLAVLPVVTTLSRSHR